jgi:glycolate oxidase subunit GlcD
MSPAPLPDLPAPARRALNEVLGDARIFVDEATRVLYAADDGPRRCVPSAVAFPAEHEQVVELVRVANRHRLALVARGAGSGNVGGALPTPASIVVSFECMRRVLELNPDERLAVVEAGVPTGEIDAQARVHGLFYAPDPGSAAFCRIGGNLATGAAGPRAVKYGGTRDHVLGLRAVTGDGRTLVTGCRTTKGVVGYDLTRLLVGNEGTLALITEATLRLLPAPATTGTVRACYATAADACAAVARVMTQPAIPSALELLDSASIGAIREAGAASDLPAGTRALLVAEADGDADAVARDLAHIEAALDGVGALELRRATDATDVRSLWTARRSLSRAVKRIAPLKINEDVVVPVPKLAELVTAVETLAGQYRVPIVSFGHAGNGNLHVNIMVHPDDADETARAHAALDRLMRTVVALKGTISGEHGIGYEKRAFVPLEIQPQTLATMRELKRVFDPNGILNPGKIFPDAV